MVDQKKTAVKEEEEPVTAEALERRGKRWAANFLKREPSPRLLHQLLDKLLSPLKPISDENIVEWMRWIMAADKTPEEFAEQVRSYDNAQRCGMVWTANFVAYRCRTCGISPCMSLCAECFQRGNHDGHDYNMFWSQAGGACDCGDPYVMKPTGFCSLHGQTDPAAQRGPPDSLMQLPREMMPRIFSRLLVYLRINSRPESLESNDASIMQRLDGYLNFLQNLCNMRTAMRACMTEALTSRELYRDMDLVQITQDDAQGETKLLREAYRNYVEAVNSMPNPDVAPELRALSPALQEHIQHETMLDELVFWTYKYEFPTKLVCLLLYMLPDQRYKECFTRAFVLHYARISQMLSASTDPDPLTNRVVHVSVQLFSNEQLALRMTEELHLLHAMVISLKHMTSQILINSQLHDPARNTHKVASCSDKIMKNHCYWPLVSDLSNVLSHKQVALAFVSDDGLLQMWFSYLSMYQGMHVNIRQLDTHVDMEPSTYYAAFSAELEGSAAPMWALLTHLREPGTADLTKRLLRHAYAALQQWHDAIGCPQTYEEIVEDDSMDLRCTFHLPMHRYVALIISEAVKRQGVSLQELLPAGNTMITLISHLLKLQVSFHEISAGMWVRNGNQMKGQTMTYMQCHFCCSMVDPDIYLLQLGAMTLDPDRFLTLVLKKFHVWDWLSFAPNATNSHLEADQEIPMVEACLTFLATLLCVRTCAGMPEDELARLEIATQLCMGDKTHSQLMDLLPEKSEPMNNPTLFEAALADVSRYRGPASEASGNMQQGIYGPKVEVWDTLYDPIYVLLRAMVRKEFQGSMDRFTAYVKSTGQYTDSKGSPWPPYKVPPAQPPLPECPDVRRILHCNTFYGAMLSILRRCVNDPLVSEQVMSLAIFLLEMATRKPEKEFTGQEMFSIDMDQPDECDDLQFTEWFRTPWSVDNLRRVVDNVTVRTERVYPSSSSSESDEMLMESMEMVVEDSEEPEDEDVGVLHLSPDGRPPLAALQTQQRPALLAGTEVGRLPPPEPMDQAAGASSANSGGGGGGATGGQQHQQQYAGPLALVACDSEMVSHGQQRDLLLRSPASHDMGESWFGPRGLRDAGSSSTTTTSVACGDSIVSLLLKLHSKLSDQPDSYRLPSDELLANFKESRVGNGPHFVGQLLTFIAKKDPLLKEHIKETRNRLWPRATEDESPRSEDREARRRMARERQQRLMRQFANRQRQFQEQLETEEPDVAASSRRARNVREYDCVICGQSSASTAERPFGLVVLLQATSVLSHQHTRTEPLQLPVDEESSQQLRSRLRHNRAAFVDSRHDRLANTFENKNWLLSMNLGVTGGVHVQTCGHNIHLDCHRMYVRSLTTPDARGQSINLNKREYSCPLCRQLCNHVLPLLEADGAAAALHPAYSRAEAYSAISRLLNDVQVPEYNNNFAEPISHAMDGMTRVTFPKFRITTPQTPAQNILNFVNSVARTHLEIEVIQRDGGLTNTADAAAQLVPSVKRSSLVPLLTVLGYNAKMLSLENDPTYLPVMWTRLNGLMPNARSEITLYQPDVPLLLRDPTSMLLLTVLTLPMPLPVSLYACIVQALYNLAYVQACAALSFHVPHVRRRELTRASQLSRGGGGGRLQTMESALGLVVELLSSVAGLYTEDGVDELLADTSPHGLAEQVAARCLPFLRLAAVLRLHLYQQPLPDPRSADQELPALLRYLQLAEPTGAGPPPRRHTGDDGHGALTVGAMRWTVTDGEPVVQAWCREFCSLAQHSQSTARELVRQQRWCQPQLLRLPQEYKTIFLFYHRRHCTRCGLVPKEPTVCLLCGTLVCLRGQCCKVGTQNEAVAHSVDCGSGTCIFLAVNSSTVIVIRGRRACLWGSVYLDSFGEEDRDLKRGRPLFLCEERYRLLQNLWLSHAFDNTRRRWIWHKEML